MKKSLLCTALCAATLVALLLPGCSGGALPGNPFPTATPRPAATATSAPAVSQTSNFTLGNGQRAILNTTRRSTALSGTIQILAPVGTNRTATALTRSIKIGTFSITGVFTPERSYNITVKDGNTTLFTQTGLFPTATQAGTYSITTSDGQTDSGTIPQSGPIAPTPVPSASATPKPSATTPPSNIPAGINLTFTPSNPANFPIVPLQNTQFLVDSGTGSLIMTLSNTESNATLRYVQASLAKPAAGKTYTFPPTVGAGFIGRLAVITATTSFEGIRGQVTINSLTANSASLTFKNVFYQSENGETVTVNGTVNNPFTAQ